MGIIDKTGLIHSEVTKNSDHESYKSMRVFLFRGFDKQGKGWVFGDLTHGKKVLTQTPYLEDCIMVGGYEVEEDTVGQFIGLQDTSSKEMFEGDIVKTNLSGKPFGVITWHPNGYFFIDTTFGKWNRFCDNYISVGELMEKSINDDPIELYVIGNIHDNPELIPEERGFGIR